MSLTSARVEPSIAGAGDYIGRMKPRVMSLVVFTALVGMVPLGIVLWPFRYAGLYGIAAIVIGAAMIALALRVRRETSGCAACKHVFAFSVLYLCLFAVLLVDPMSAGLIGHITA